MAAAWLPFNPLYSPKGITLISSLPCKRQGVECRVAFCGTSCVKGGVICGKSEVSASGQMALLPSSQSALRGGKVPYLTRAVGLTGSWGSRGLGDSGQACRVLILPGHVTQCCEPRSPGLRWRKGLSPRVSSTVAVKCCWWNPVYTCWGATWPCRRWEGRPVPPGPW